MEMIVRFKKLDERATMPSKATPLAAGIDFHAIEQNTIIPGCRLLIKTGIGWEVIINSKVISDKLIPYLQLQGRSGLAYRHGIDVLAGVIDNDYRGDIGFILYNTGQMPITIKEGDKIGQGIVLWTPRYAIVEAAYLSATIRGAGGFGSTGE